MAVEFLPCGDTGLTVQFGDGIDRTLNQRILRIRAAVDEANLPGVVETVPTYRSLMIHYDPMRTSHAEIVEAMTPFLDIAADGTEATGTHWRIPMCFDAEFAPDIERVAEFGATTPDTVIDVLASTPQYVYMLGFAPGQPYMGDLPENLAIPRNKNPKPGVPQGSLVTATGLTNIYPITNPTGWHIVGRSPVLLFDPRRTQRPVLLSPGDVLHFERIDRKTFDSLREQALAAPTTPETGGAA